MIRLRVARVARFVRSGMIRLPVARFVRSGMIRLRVARVARFVRSGMIRSHHHSVQG